MHLLLCHERFVSRYGVDRVLLLLAREFRRRGHRVTLLGQRFDAGAHEAADRVVCLPTPADTLQADLFCLRWLQEHWAGEFAGPDNRPDAVLDSGWPFFSAIPFFEERGCRVTYADYGVIPADGLPAIGVRTLGLLQELKETFVPAASAVITISRFLWETQTSACTRSGQQVAIIPAGCDHADEAAVRLSAPIRPPGAELEHPRILALGRFEPGTYKQSELVYRFERLVRKWAPKAWIGALASPESVVEHAWPASTGVEGIGFPSDEALFRLLRECDLCVCFSRWEGFGLPLAEAQTLGRTCLVFNLAAHPEVAAHPWVLCQTVEEMAGKARELEEGRAPLPLRDGSAFRRGEGQLGWSEVAERYLDVVLGNTGTPASPLRDSLMASGSEALEASGGRTAAVPAGLLREISRFRRVAPVFWDSTRCADVSADASDPSGFAWADLPGGGRENSKAASERCQPAAVVLTGSKAGGAWLLLPATIEEDGLASVCAWARSRDLRTVLFLPQEEAIESAGAGHQGAVEERPEVSRQARAEPDLSICASPEAEAILRSRWRTAGVCRRSAVWAALAGAGEEEHGGPAVRAGAIELLALLAYTRWAEMERVVEQARAKPEIIVTRPLVRGRISVLAPRELAGDGRETFLHSLVSSLGGGHEVEWIEVDDGSPEDTLAWLHRDNGGGAQHRQVVSGGAHRGSAFLVNRAVEIATGEFVLFVDDGVRFAPGWLDPMLEMMAARPGAFAVASVQFAPSGRQVVAAGVTFDPSGCPVRVRDFGGGDGPDPCGEYPAVDFGCTLVRRDRMLELAGCDPAFRADAGAIDLCLRARARGWPSYACAGSVVRRVDGAGGQALLNYPADRQSFFARWQTRAVILGRDWEERRFWQQHPGQGNGADARRSVSLRVMVDLTGGDAPAEPPEWLLSLPLAAGAAAPGRFSFLFVVRPAQAERVQRSLTIGDEVWVVAPEAGVPLPPGVRPLRNPPATLARSLDADLVYVAAGSSNFLAADIPVLAFLDGPAADPRQGGGAGAAGLRARLEPCLAASTMVHLDRAFCLRDAADRQVDAGRRVVLTDLAAGTGEGRRQAVRMLLSAMETCVESFQQARLSWRWSDLPSQAQRPAGTSDVERDGALATEEIPLCMDEPRNWSDPTPLLLVQGWCLPPDGVAVTDLWAEVGASRVFGTWGLPRPDLAVAFPGKGNAARGGFSVRFRRPHATGATSVFVGVRLATGARKRVAEFEVAPLPG